MQAHSVKVKTVHNTGYENSNAFNIVLDVVPENSEPDLAREWTCSVEIATETQGYYGIVNSSRSFLQFNIFHCLLREGEVQDMDSAGVPLLQEHISYGYEEYYKDSTVIRVSEPGKEDSENPFLPSHLDPTHQLFKQKPAPPLW